MDSHYPSSADLATFRRRILPTTGLLVLLAPFVPPKSGGAWPDEREHGIGHQYATDGCLPDWTCQGTIARREASCMRSAAFVRLGLDSLDDDGCCGANVFAPPTHPGGGAHHA